MLRSWWKELSATFYAQKHPDGWKAELVLLVHSDERATHLAELIGQWRTAAIAPFRS